MKADDRQSFTELMRAVFALYGKEFSEAVLAIWWEAMLAFDLSAVKDALTRHAMNPDNGQFLPKPADVVRLLGGSTKDSALVAWTKAIKAASEVGAYRSVDFDDPVISTVIRDMGGWVEFCHRDIDDLGFVQNEFVNRYRGYATRGELPAPISLPGIVEGHNRIGGFGVPEPVLVGNRKLLSRK